jgi:hypothetical protein
MCGNECINTNNRVIELEYENDITEDGPNREDRGATRSKNILTAINHFSK